MQGLGKKLRAARESRNLSLRELAGRADISASMLSQIENGKSNPSVRTLYNIAAALDMPVDAFFPNRSEADMVSVSAHDQSFTDKTASELRALTVEGVINQDNIGFAESGEEDNGPVVRVEERSEIKLRGGVTWKRLTGSPEKDVEFLEVTYQSGATSGTRMSHHSGREFGLIVSGELTLDLGFDQYILTAGDTIVFDSTKPHRLTNKGAEEMKAIWVILEQ